MAVSHVAITGTSTGISGLIITAVEPILNHYGIVLTAPQELAWASLLTLLFAYLAYMKVIPAPPDEPTNTSPGS